MKDDKDAAAEEPQQVTVVFRKPYVQPGTLEAQEAGCLCRFESNMEAGFLSAERRDKDTVMMVIKEGCPLHKIINKPMDDALGDL